MDVAAAAVRLVHEAGDAAPHEAPPVRAGEAPRPRGRVEATDRTTLWLSVGKRAGVGPGDLVGAIAGEARVEADAIGAIRILEGYSLVEVSAELADRILAALARATIRGQRVKARRERPQR